VAEGRLPPERIVHILDQVTSALAAAHEASFVHRDLKPENIYLVEREGTFDYVKLLDFGIAKSLAGEAARAGGGPRGHVTVEGTFLGTPAYASPEQASGKAVDHRTDIYSLGVILYELVCGRLPFEGRNLGEFLVQHLTREPPPPPEEVAADPSRAALFAVALRCLEKDPALRFPDAGALRHALGVILRSDTAEVGVVTGLEPSPTAVPAPPPRRRGRRLALGGALLLALVGGALAIGGLRRPGRPGGLDAPSPAATTTPAPATPPEAPRGPRRVHLRFTSSPPGAETRRANDGALLGITPFEQSFLAADDGLLEVVMTKEGHEPLALEASLARDGTVAGALPRRPRVAGAGKAPPRGPAARAPAPRARAGTGGPGGAAGARGGAADRAPRPVNQITVNPFGR
jgi:serine/threonine-protein kinase